jgi:hypothetical protein
MWMLILNTSELHHKFRLTERNFSIKNNVHEKVSIIEMSIIIFRTTCASRRLVYTNWRWIYFPLSAYLSLYSSVIEEETSWLPTLRRNQKQNDQSLYGSSFLRLYLILLSYYLVVRLLDTSMGLLLRYSFQAASNFLRLDLFSLVVCSGEI